ncbi:MAG: magnesium protoporphyrin IX methyltransferase [Pseudomonadota bacterium]
MADTYTETRARLETYFDKTASKTWERLTSDAPVSRIRQTVRAGRDAMRAELMGLLPTDLAGARVLDAGCGAGQLAVDLARRGAEVVAVDISPSLLDVAARRAPEGLSIDWRAGDMLGDHGRFDFVVAMDSLIHYRPGDIAAALMRLGAAGPRQMAFTLAPRTPLLAAMHLAGKAFPRSDRSPAIVPISAPRLRQEMARKSGAGAWQLRQARRVATGFYISQAWEMRACT